MNRRPSHPVRMIIPYAILSVLAVSISTACSTKRPFFFTETDRFYADDAEVVHNEKNFRLRLGMKRSEIVRMLGSDRDAMADAPRAYPVSFYYRDDRVAGIVIGRGPYRTARGVGGGDTMERVAAAYPTTDNRCERSESSISIVYDRTTMTATTRETIACETERYARSPQLKESYRRRASAWIHIVFVFGLDRTVKLVCIADSIAIPNFNM